MKSSSTTFTFPFLFKFAFLFLVGSVLWMVPAPEGVTLQAWHLLAIFVATILGIILKPIPMGAIALIGISLTVITHTLTITQALSGFGNSTIWLIVTAFFFARGFIKTGLGDRIGYLFMRLFGKKSLGLAYSLVVTDLILAPAIPSNTARGGGVIYPLLRSVSRTYGSNPEDGTAGKLGSFLVLCSFQALVVSGAMFLTGMAANPLSVKFAAQQGVDISWSMWTMASIVPGLLSLTIIPLILYKLYPPEIKNTPMAVQLAREKLKEMGTVTSGEWIMLSTFLLLLILWIFGQSLHIHSTVAALAGLSVLLITSVLEWKDILNEKGAWDTLIWFAALVMMASFLNNLGLIHWFSLAVGSMVTGINWITAFLILSLVYFYSHYLFASNTAHISAMYAAFLAVAIAVGTPPVLAALVLAFFGNLMSSMTHYGTGPAPVFFGSGFVEMSSWWKFGLLLSIVNIVIWLGIGGLWWKVLGLW